MKEGAKPQRVVVVGAGMVGVSAALWRAGVRARRHPHRSWRPRPGNVVRQRGHLRHLRVHPRSTPPGGSSTPRPCSSTRGAPCRSSGRTCPGSCPGRCASSPPAGRAGCGRRCAPSPRSSSGRRRGSFPSRAGRGSSRSSALPARSTSTSRRKAGGATAGTASGAAPTGSPCGTSTRARSTSWSRPSPTSCTGGATWRTCSTCAVPTRWWTGSPARSCSGAGVCARPR